MTIECMSFKAHKSGSLLGFANLFVPKMGLEIFGLSLHQKEGKRWLNMPSREYEDENGERKYLSIIRFREKSHYNAFIDKAKECIEKWCVNNGEEISVGSEEFQQEEMPF